MGYLNEFRATFSKRLEGLDAEAREQTLNEACNALLASYRNGQKSARAERREKRGADGSAKGGGKGRPKK